MPEYPMLLVCDHRGEGLAESLRPLGQSGYRVQESHSLRESRERLESLAPDLILIDPLARGGAVELEQLDLARTKASTPILIIGEARDPLPAVESARSLTGGPWDLVYRDAPLEEIQLRIERLRSHAEGLAELDEMRYHAVHDDHTGLLRPRPFQARLLEHFSAAQRHRFDLALALIDLDGFGQVNKEHDHMVGDEIIRKVGSVIRETIRIEDVGGRIGGDEFAIVLPYTRRVDAALVVSRLRDRIYEVGPKIVGCNGDSPLVVSASLGFETFDGVDLDSLDHLRRHAEVALRNAKSRGGNRGMYYRSLEV
ncbi:MAG: diguanylate cyclase (GGDEF)-like protein [Planctomycetota bacterium]|jgi:diguanylate cyclase (GGDEF)-like protein